MDKILIAILLTVLILIIIYVMISYDPKKNESFEIILGDDKAGIISRVNLQHFFQFVEYFQTGDMSTNQLGQQKKRVNFYSNDEHSYIKNNILTLLKMLDFIINVNEKDNYYSRFFVIKVGSNLEYSKKFPFRRQNYEELVEGKVGKQFTFLPQNEYDLYAPRASHQGTHQYPLPNTISVRNYYSSKNTEVNLMALKMLLERIHGDDSNSFTDIYQPSEHQSFLSEFMVPLKIIKNNILHITNTNSYKEYLKTHKYSDQYKDVLFRIDEEL